eukprot:Macronucleus_36.p1 GENE.Macronucleus_36~~Macronucleus_36.p1  ORF type:complete len:473 (+),score=103.56 Macronucleus_36:1-1419(+)
MGGSLPEGTETFDYVVIGAGSGGMASARRAAQYGKRVCLIENRVIGGTCVNVGCVPKKVMFNLANFLEEAQVMKGYGVTGLERIGLNFKHFKAKRDAYVKRLNSIYKNFVETQDITYIEGTASFIQDQVVAVGDRLFHAPHILIASGSAPEPGSFEGAEHCINSDDFFNLETLPESIVVIGGGYIGIELAQILQAFGVQVTLLVRSRPLKFLDSDITDVLVESMQRLGIDVRLNSPHQSVIKNWNDMLTVKLESGETINTEQCLLALGRPPNLRGLDLEKTSIQTEKGAIVVDEFQNTAAYGVYALGDVTNQVTLTPVAVKTGRILAERLFNGRADLKMCFENIATVIFSHPPIGTCGLSAQEATAKLGDDQVKVFTCGFTNMFYSPAEEQHKQKSFFKIVCQITGEDNGKDYSHLKVVGCHGIGKGIDEMMQGISVAITMGATKQDFDNSVAIHPTASEEFVLFEPRYANY